MAWEKINVSKDDINAVKTFKKEVLHVYIDENIESEIIDFLKTKKFNIKTFKDYWMQWKSDDDHFKLSKKEWRVLITKDDDFWNNKMYPIKWHPWIIILKYSNINEAIPVLSTLISVIKPFFKVYEESKILIKHKEIDIYSKKYDTWSYWTNKYLLDRGDTYVWE